MKIGIITFWTSKDNYGQILQCYSLQRYLRDEGHDAFLIRYIPHDDYERSPFWKQILKALNPFVLFEYLFSKVVDLKITKEQMVNDRKFDEFTNQYINVSDIVYKSYAELKNNPPDADMYIVGSDQVWNPAFTGGKDKKAYRKIVNAYFLNFGSQQTKRISYAASWGIKALDKEKEKLIAPMLKNFDYVSVREENGIELCRQCGLSSVEWVCDPTMLLSAERYRGIYQTNSIHQINKPYILIYILKNKIKFNIESVYSLAAEKGLDVIYVTGNGIIDKKEKFFATIPEWLYLIDNAEYVITNSFHCGVFSTIFEKQYGIIPLSGKAAKMNGRFDCLFKFFGIDNRYLYGKSFDVLFKKYSIKKIESSFNDVVKGLFDA